MGDFMDYLISKLQETKEVIDENGKKKKIPKFNAILVLAHNSSGCDAQFILDYMFTSDRFPRPDIITNGTKIIQIAEGRLKFLDSLIYFQKSLASLPK